MGASRNLVLTLSVGDRPWFPRLRPYMEAYARRWGADFEAVMQSPGEPCADGMACRREKIDAIHRATAQYDRVLYLDDTIFIRPDAPILEGPPADDAKPPIWATLETHHPRGMALLYAALQYYEVPRRSWTLLNSGVMLVRAAHHPMFDLAQAKPMKKFGYFADQLWINVMQQKHAFPVHDLGPRFNFVGSFLTGKVPAPVQADEAHFFHITRAVGDAPARLRLLEALVQQFG